MFCWLHNCKDAFFQADTVGIFLLWVCVCVWGCDEVVWSSPLREAVTSYTDSHQSSFLLLWVLPGNAVPVSHLALTHTTHHTHTDYTDTLRSICHSAMIQGGGGRCEKAHPDCTNTHTRPAAQNNSHLANKTKALNTFLFINTDTDLSNLYLFSWTVFSQIQA